MGKNKGVYTLLKSFHQDYEFLLDRQVFKYIYYYENFMHCFLIKWIHSRSHESLKRLFAQYLVVDTINQNRYTWNEKASLYPVYLSNKTVFSNPPSNPSISFDTEVTQEPANPEAYVPEQYYNEEQEFDFHSIDYEGHSQNPDSYLHKFYS